MLFSAFLVLNVLGSVCGDFRVPILTQPLSTFNLPFLQGFMRSNQAYYDRVTTYNVWKTPRAIGDQISAFDVIVGSTAQTMVFDADVLLQRGQLSVAILEQTPLYNCPDQCYTVKDADIANATSLTSNDLVNVAALEIGEIHQFAVTTMEKKFCFNMTVLEQKLNLSSLRVINDEWALFVPDIVAAAIKCRADMLSVTVDELAELLNTNTATLYGYNLNQIESIFFPAFDDLVVRKNRFETQLFSVVISGQASSQWQSRTMAYYANQISQFSVRHLEILYRWASAQLFAIENIQLSSYFSQCTSLSIAGSAFDLSQDIFGYQTTLPSCNVAFVLSRSLSEDEVRFNLATITNRNILTIIRNASSISSWFNFYQLLFAISEGIWMETPLITQVQARQGLTNAQIITYSVPQIAYAIRTLNGSGDLNLIMRDNYQQYLSLLLQTYGFSKSSLGVLTGRTEAQIDSLTIQEAHNLVFEALYLRYNINEFLSKLTVAGVDNFVAINLPSFEWYRLVRAAIESSFDQLASAFSTNLTAGTGGVSVITLADGTSSIQIRSGSISSSFVISASRLASCLGTTASEIYQRTMPSYQTLYQSSAVDLMNRKIILDTENLNALLARLGITFDSIKNTETVGQTIQNRVGLTAEQLRCMYGWSSQFTSFLFGITWGNVSSFRLCNDYTSWPLHRIAVALLYSSPTVCQLCSTGPCDANADCTDTVGSYICTCRTGFTGNGVTCTDLDECVLGTHTCSVNGLCTNTIGSYTCQCNTGYTGNGFICTDINECALNIDNCGQNAACTNTPGSFVCTCIPGYTGNGLSCTDINECALNTDNCHTNAACTNTIGSFTCACNVGFAGNGVICVDINECTIGTHNCHRNPIEATCTNTIGSFTCACNTGYTGDGRTCTDIDECTLNLHSCHAQATCTNTAGSYTCACNTGWSGNGRNCLDINECVLNIDNCDANVRATCTNTPGSFTCACNTGYSGNGITCVDINECTLGIDNCDGQAACVNTIGSFNCGCNVGYSGDGVTCVDINECDLNLDNCHLNATCSNTIGSFFCTCRPGFSGNGVSCIDIDECALDIHLCDRANGRCFNVKGSYTCTCNNGYRGDGRTCVDIDECAEQIDNCDDNAQCTNLPGTFTCACNAGFDGNGINCLNINECARGTDNCHVNATCTDTIGSWTCQCNVGFTGNGISCIDIDECALGIDSCSDDGICDNNIGSYTCRCKAGFSGDGRTCTDIDECTVGTHNCHVNANCINTRGSFLCTCKTGYEGNGVTCIDINECTRGTHNCPGFSTCLNTPGSFICQCGNGLRLVNGVCVDIDECNSGLHNCHAFASCSNTFGGFTCQCRTGYAGNGTFCRDIDECAANTDNCHVKATCTNTIGSYSCQCITGYEGNGTHCVDINECVRNTDNCHANALCTNTDGSFQCTCLTGYAGNGVICADIDECTTNTHNCHINAQCSNTQGSFRCTCNPGYTGSGTNCVDINECNLNIHSCHQFATCSNTQGSFECRCNVGYEGDGVNCRDINECVVSSSCHTNADCTDTVGSFTCQCKSGYTGDGFACVDINECLNNPCHANAVCQNTLGSFTCACNVGYSGNGFNCVDTNECSTGTPCGSGGTCLNNEGSYTCNCTQGYTGITSCEDINECTNPDICPENSQCINSPGSYMCNCDIGYTGSPQCTILPDAFISITLTIKDREFTNSLNDRNSGDYQTLSGQVRSNFDKEFSNVPQYRDVNIMGFRRGSVIFDAELVFVPGSEDEITRVLDDISATGVLGDFSLVPGSLTTRDIPAFSGIKMRGQYEVNAGDMLEITCTVSGPSLPSFEWRNGSMILFLSTRVKIENNDQVSKLFVRNTAKSDSGDYYCIASKGEDTINSSARVEVKVIPVVAVSPLSVSATEGTTITLTCQVSVGNEENIEYMWYNSKQSSIVGQARKLELSNFPLSDGDPTYTTVYWCSAKNSDGTGRSQNVTVYIVSKDFNEFCFKNDDSDYTWEKTPVSSSVVKNCPNGTTGTVTRACNSNHGGPVWGDVNFSNCRTSAVVKLVDKVSRLDAGFESESITEILEETEQVSEDDELYEQDVRDIVYVLEKTKEKTKTQNDRQNFIRSSSNIVSENKLNVWENIPSRNDLAKEIISGTDLNARNYISQTAETGKVVTYSTPNIDVRGTRLATIKPTELKLEDISLLDSVGEGVIIPAVVTNELTQATVVKYRSIKDILSEEELKNSVDNTIGSTESLTIRSTIVSFISEPQFNESASDPFKIVLQNNQTGYVRPRRTCAFIEPEINNSMWGSEGCTLNEAESNEENVTCDCDHTTAFAIMMDVAGVQLTDSERKILETISTVGCSISLVGIALTILMHVLFWKRVKSPRAKILVNLCVAIGFTDIFAILEGVARGSPNFCKAVAALLHFFVLSAFGWMLCEGILLYILLIRIFDGVRGKHWKIFYFIGWGIPLLIVAVSFGATQGEGYGTESSCWLSVENKLIWAFVGPAFLVILANTIVFVMVLRTMMNSQKIKLQDNVGKVRTGVKASVIIFPILGLTWIFGVMTFNRETLFFRYLFAVFNSAQGFLIFLFHCVLNKQIRDAVRNSTWRRSTLSTGSGKNYFRYPKSSSSSPKKTVIGSGINEKMVEKSARLQLESNGWKSESGGHGENNNLNVSVAEQARENENMMSPLQGHSSSNEFVGQDNDAVEGEAYHRTGNGELGNSSSTDRPSNNEEAHLAV